MKKLLFILFISIFHVCYSQVYVVTDNTGKPVVSNTGAVIIPVNKLVIDSLTTRPRVWFSDALMTKYYIGKWARFRRSSDNAESDFGYVNNYADTTGLRTWYGASATVYLVTRYDQMSRYNATQTVAGNQPIWDKVNKHVDCDLTLFIATSTFTTALAQPNTFYVVGAMNPVVTGSNQNFCSGIVSANSAISIAATTGKWRINFSISVSSLNNSNGNLHLFRTLANGASSALYIDGVLDVTGNAGASSCDGLTIGTNSGGATGMGDGYYLTVGVFDTTPSAADITQLYNYFKRTFGTP